MNGTLTVTTMVFLFCCFVQTLILSVLTALGNIAIPN